MTEITLQVFCVPKWRIKRCRGMAQPVRGGCAQAVHLISLTAFSAYAVQRIIKNRLEEGAHLSIGEA